MQPTKHTHTESKGNNGNKDKGKPMQTQTAPQPAPKAATPPKAGQPVFGEPIDEKDLPPPAVQLSKEEKRALLEKVFSCEAAIDTAEEAVKLAKAANSVAVRELVAKAGSGPWKVDGVLIKARLYGKDGNDYACLVRPNDTSVEEL